MQTTRELIAATAGQWKLTGITNTAGQCDDCTRRLTQRVFEVTHPEHGVLLLGRRCATRATGYQGGALDRELRVAARSAELDRRRPILAARFPGLDAALNQYGADVRAARAAGFDPSGVPMARGVDLFQTAWFEDSWWGGHGRTAFPSWEAYVLHYLPDAA